MESGDLIIFILFGTILLVKFLRSINTHLLTLDISEHELAADFLVQRPDLYAVRLKPLCPEPLTGHWQRMSLLLDFSFFSIATVMIGFVIFKDYLYENADLNPTIHASILFAVLLTGFGFPTVKNFLNRRRFRDQKIVFGDGSERWITEYEKSPSLLKALVYLCFLPLLLVGLFILKDEGIEPDTIVHWGFLLNAVVMILYTFRSEQTALGKAGLFDRGSFVPWSRVVEYRWFEDRSALLLIVDRWSSKSPMVIFPVQEELREQVELLLQEYAADKQREEVELALEKLDSPKSSTTQASPA